MDSNNDNKNDNNHSKKAESSRQAAAEQPAPVKIRKVDTRLMKTVYGWPALLVSLPFLAVGMFFSLGSFLEWDVIKEGANAPLWVIGAAGMIFFLGGFMLFKSAAQGIYIQHRRKRVRALHGDKPWLYDFNWGDSSVSDQAFARVMTDLAGAILISIFLVPFIWWAYLSGQGPLPVQIIVGLFTIIWLLVIGTVVYRLLRFVRYGHSTLHFDRFPYQPGDTIKVGFENTRFTEGSAELRFVEEKFVNRRSGGENSVRHESFQYYSETQRFSCKPDSFVSLAFQLPEEPSWVNQLIADPSIRYWELVVKSRMPGVDFRTTFVLPVYPLDEIAARDNDDFGRRYARGPESNRMLRLFALVNIPLVLLGLAWLLAPGLLEEFQRQEPVSPDPNQRLEAERQAMKKRQVEKTQEIERARQEREQTVLQEPEPSLLERTPFELHRRYHPDAMGLHMDGQGLLAVTKTHVVDFGSGDVLLNGSVFRKLFDHKFSSFASVYREGDTVWLGSWYGELYQYRNGTWTQHITRDEYRLSRIFAIVRFRGDLLLAGWGLLRWDESRGQGTKVPGSEGLRISDMMIHRGRLLISAGESIYEFDGNSVFKSAEVPHRINALGASREGLLVSTSGGLFRERSGGFEHLLEGMTVINALQDRQGRLVVGIRKQGVYGSADGRSWVKFKGLPGDHPLDVVIDEDSDKAWIAFYGKGISSGPYTYLAEQVLR